MSAFQQFLTFAVIGALGFGVDLAVLYGGLALGLGYFAGRAVSFSCAVLFTWQCNRRLTFRQTTAESLWAEGSRYFVAMTLGGAANLAVYAAIVSVVAPGRWVPFFGVALGSIAGMTINFVGARFWVFTAGKPPNR